MAEERDDAQRTEEPTQRRLDEAHDKGDVVKSGELSTFILLSGGTLALVLFAGQAARNFAATFSVFLARPEELTMDGPGVAEVFHRVLSGIFGMLGPSVAVLLLAALAGQLLQHRPVFTAERLKLDLTKLSPIKGFKRLFGLDGIINLIKGIIKIGLVGAVGFTVLWPERDRIGATLGMNPAAAMGLALALIGKFLLAALCVLAVLSALDYLYQRQRFYSRHRMTRQELKDEFKQSEGDPQVRAKIRQLRQERARSRMMAAVPKATVVIVNPTHYAVALSYESGKMVAPVCVAKGIDDVALRIRQVAEENEVPIVENPPLARALHAAVDVEEAIPPEHYKAVAQIIGYVMRLAAQNRFWRD